MVNKVNNILLHSPAFKLAYGAAAVAITAVSAQISIPLPPIPWTLQVFAVLLVGGVLGSKIGALSQLIYLMLGLIGVPVFANFHGGPQMVFSPSFGYILAFPIAAAISGISVRFPEKKTLSVAVFFLALIPIYIIGPVYFYLIAPIALGKKLPITGVIAAGVLPFIIPDIIKASLAFIISSRLSMIAGRNINGDKRFYLSSSKNSDSD